MYESIKTHFCSIISSCFFFLFLVIDLYFLIPAMIAQIFNASYSELVIPTRTPTNEVKGDIKIHPLTAKTKI